MSEVTLVSSYDKDKEAAPLLGGCRLIDLPKVVDARGNLTFIEGSRHLPFEARRVFYLYDVPAGESRAGHAHRELEEVIIAVSGSFDVLIDNGYQTLRVHKNRPYCGLYVPQKVWRSLDNFSSGSVCLVLASRPYDPDDYYRDYNEFLAGVRSR